MFALVSRMLDVVWEAAADAEQPDRFRNADGLDEDAYSAYRDLLPGLLFKILRAVIETTEAGNPWPDASYEPLRVAVERQCDLMWCAALDAHRSPDFRLADDRLDDELHRTYRRNVREAGVTEILNARPGSVGAASAAAILTARPGEAATSTMPDLG